MLVHGTGHGGWCWKFVRETLEKRGHRVYAPTLTGCGERSHLLHPDIGLETHITDVVNVLKWEGLEDVVLVGHSYGGCVISGVADRAKARLRHLVYLDTVILRDGESLVSSRHRHGSGEVEADGERRLSLAPDGKYIAAGTGARYGIPPDPPEVLAWVNRRLTPHPLKSWLEPLRLKNGGEEGVPRTFIRCTDPEMPYSGIRDHARFASNHPDWRYEELATGHDAMVTAPQACARLFLEAARAS